jgi:hypothetical protein
MLGQTTLSRVRDASFGNQSAYQGAGGGAVPGEVKTLPQLPSNELLSMQDVIRPCNVNGATPEARTKALQGLFNNVRTEAQNERKKKIFFF